MMTRGKWTPDKVGFTAWFDDGSSAFCPVTTPGDPATVVVWHERLEDVQAFVATGAQLLRADTLDDSPEAQADALRAQLATIDSDAEMSRPVRDLALAFAQANPSYAAMPAVKAAQAAEEAAAALRSELADAIAAASAELKPLPAPDPVPEPLPVDGATS